MKAVALSLWGLVCALVTASAQPKAIAPGILHVGTLQDSSLQESSGVVASRQHEGVFWTHNDGKMERLYAIDRQGKTLAQFQLTGVKVEDWEDIALDSENRLYVADTGNNKGNRSQVTVHRLVEPNPKPHPARCQSRKAGSYVSLRNPLTVRRFSFKERTLI